MVGLQAHCGGLPKEWIGGVESSGLQGDEARWIVAEASHEESRGLSNSQAGGVVACRVQRAVVGGRDVCPCTQSWLVVCGDGD